MSRGDGLLWPFLFFKGTIKIVPLDVVSVTEFCCQGSLMMMNVDVPAFFESMNRGYRDWETDRKSVG